MVAAPAVAKATNVPSGSRTTAGSGKSRSSTGFVYTAVEEAVADASARSGSGVRIAITTVFQYIG